MFPTLTLLFKIIVAISQVFEYDFVTNKILCNAFYIFSYHFVLSVAFFTPDSITISPILIGSSTWLSSSTVYRLCHHSALISYFSFASVKFYLYIEWKASALFSVFLSFLLYKKVEVLTLHNNSIPQWLNIYLYPLLLSA